MEDYAVALVDEIEKPLHIPSYGDIVVIDSRLSL